MSERKDSIYLKLLEYKDEKYGDFQAALMPDIPRYRVIGVRTPMLRKYAAEIAGSSAAVEFLSALPHEYYEENNLHAFLLEKIKDFDEAVCAVDKFLPYVDNWATCDGMSPKVFVVYPEKLLSKIGQWLASEHTYTIRYGMLMLMKYFLDGRFKTEYSDAVAGVQSEEYYVRMMQAWYFATALSKQYDEVLPYIKEKRLPAWVHNKTIQKAVESHRISEEQKAYLRTLKV